MSGTNFLWTESPLYLNFKQYHWPLCSCCYGQVWKQPWAGSNDKLPWLKGVSGRTRPNWAGRAHELEWIGLHVNLPNAPVGTSVTHCDMERRVFRKPLDSSLVTCGEARLWVSAGRNPSTRSLLQGGLETLCCLSFGESWTQGNWGFSLSCFLFNPSEIQVFLCKWILLSPVVLFAAGLMLFCNYLITSDAILPQKLPLQDLGFASEYWLHVSKAELICGKCAWSSWVSLKWVLIEMIAQPWEAEFEYLWVANCFSLIRLEVLSGSCNRI